MKIVTLKEGSLVLLLLVVIAKQLGLEVVMKFRVAVVFMGNYCISGW